MLRLFRHPEAGRMHAQADAEQLQHGQALYGPFMGSGSTLIVAETCQRTCLGLEVTERILMLSFIDFGIYALVETATER